MREESLFEDVLAAVSALSVAAFVVSIFRNPDAPRSQAFVRWLDECSRSRREPDPDEAYEDVFLRLQGFLRVFGGIAAIVGVVAMGSLLWTLGALFSEA